VPRWSSVYSCIWPRSPTTANGTCRHAITRYSALADIDTTNVASLATAWTFSTGVLRGHEAAPIVVGDTMYIVTPCPNMLHALDLGREGEETGTPTLLLLRKLGPDTAAYPLVIACTGPALPGVQAVKMRAHGTR